RELLPADLSGLVVVDAGCGLADFHAYLAENGDLPARYIGLEMVEPLLQRSRPEARVERCDVLRDPLPAADYYVCSGAMNNLTREETHHFIQRCLDAASRGFVFNLLKGRPRHSMFNYFLPEEIREWGEGLGVGVEVVEGYLDNDFTAAFRHLADPCGDDQGPDR
ncbi:MAG: class I SAM-dependent methyltransferase, partial [Ectothiorhodospira sp.]